MHINRFITSLFTLSIVLLYSAGSTAQDLPTSSEASDKKYYDIEIVVFKNKSVPKGDELNLPTPSPSKTALTVDLSDPNSLQKALQFGFSTLQQENLRLSDLVHQIVVSSRYDLLTHIGWRQPGLSSSESIPVWITGGKIYDKGYSSIDQQEPVSVEQTEILNPALAVTPEIDTETENDNTLVTPLQKKEGFYELEGRIIITLSRYLHTQADLVLRKPATMQNMVERTDNLNTEIENDSFIGKKLLNYGLNEKRRMRSRKLHYLDNPQFGMLILITPYEKSEVETVDDSVLLPATLPDNEEDIIPAQTPDSAQ